MNYPSRNPMRLKNYDYSQNGAYFITVSTIIGQMKRYVSKEIGFSVW